MNALSKISLPLFFILIFSILPASMAYAQDPISVAIKQAVIKVIKAIDLQIQRLQNKTIDLQNIQKQVENTLSKLKLQEIADWTQKHKILYEEYFEELWKVKAIIRHYRRIMNIISMGKRLVDGYKRSYNIILSDNHFTVHEKEYISSIYQGIIDKTAETLDQILLILESYSLQVSDAQRLEVLSRSTKEIEIYVSDLRRFTDHNIQLCLQRAKNLDEVNQIRKLYGLQH